jgi:hypothetical protein
VFESYATGSAVALGKGDNASWTALADTDFTNTSVLQGVAVYPAASWPSA